jgi:cyclic beta-1,2-glucan synthetase
LDVMPNEEVLRSGEHTTSEPEIAAGTLPEHPPVSDDALREDAGTLAGGWEMMPAGHYETGLPQRLKELKARLRSLLKEAQDRVSGKELTPQLELLESSRMLEAAIVSSESAAKAMQALPHIRLPHGMLPRVTNLAEAYLSRAQGIWSPRSLSLYVEYAQKKYALLLDEVLLLPQALKHAQLEYILDRAQEAFAAGPLPPIEQSPFSAPLHSMRRLNQFEWRLLLESLVSFDATLRQDPAQAYAGMEDETRHAYQLRVAHLAAYADEDEAQVARTAFHMAREAARAGDADPRLAQRKSHIGFYLLAEGLPELKRRIGYHSPAGERMRLFLRTYNEYVYVFGIITLSLLLILPITAPLIPHHSFWAVMGTLLLALIPLTQGIVDLVNSLVLSLLKAEALPKLDYSEGVPLEAATLVVVPTLLLSEKQVQELFEDLEARYLSNEDPNIHFGLLTDLPDSAVQPSPDEANALVQMALQYTENLNAKYTNGRGGSFFLLHRHRVFNARQGVWMGWERKRGKLLDLNKFLLREYDPFPVKYGPRHVLDSVRYVITLDSDTQLPRGTAARMVGTLAHPLNRGIVDARLKIVTAGYGILQPRVGVSVSSASRSRLSAIYSGETGFDIYTRAVSDVYQDLFGEGIFTGKGIYEVSVLHQVLERRFPRNALLSHDLIEGAYARAGLVTDVEVIDDYPSQHHAHARRRHRWIRGDWQILQWLFYRVPDESGRMVNNPISFISQWKIFDNLRRSLVEPFTFLVLILGWYVLPGGAVYWTIITLVLLVLPALVQLSIDLLRAVFGLNPTAIRGALGTFGGSVAFALINLTFLAHLMMLAVDAIVRTLIRSLVSGQRMLEWETAAQSESSQSSLDLYLKLSPVLALIVGAELALFHHSALLPASPILFLWLIAPLAAKWLSSSPNKITGPLAIEDRRFLAEQALYLWRFYAEFGGVENHWLIPDNVEENGLLQVRKLSPTNLGMLLNARQAACELGFLTLPELAEATLGTLATYDRLEKQRGHIFNWYDIETLKAVPPFTISTVDSGNLAASFYTLHAGALDFLKRPLLSLDSFAGVDLIAGRTEGASGGSLAERIKELFAGNIATAEASSDLWLEEEAARRGRALVTMISEFLPWLLPEFATLAQAGGPLAPLAAVPCAAEQGEHHLRAIAAALAAVDAPSPYAERARVLLPLVELAVERQAQLHRDLITIINLAEQFAEAMEYGFLFVPARQLLSIGYDGVSHEVHGACYDLLASEARIATFLAVAKGDIPQQAWFRLDRSHVLVKGRASLLSWTGTMFEYMMPSLWMRSFPNTLIANSLDAAVNIQYEHVRGIPWGISESGFADTDPQGRYGYQAWGVPQVALKYAAEDGPVISPYSTFLALPLLRKQALANLRRMASMGWTGRYGFYEAGDYTQGSTHEKGAGVVSSRAKEPRLVRSWMAHHQGMALLAVTNLLRNNIIQTWFHANPRVRAAELLLHEKALSQDTLRELKERKANESVAAA